jgi:hypothetical protein
MANAPRASARHFVAGTILEIEVDHADLIAQ